MIRRLLIHEGVSAVCRYRDDGSMQEGYGMIDQPALERLARFARDYHHMLLANADQLSMFSEMPGWTPTRGWMVFGAAHTVLGYSNLVCVLANGSHPLNDIIANLAELSDM